jgi:hypothetical protein
MIKADDSNMATQKSIDQRAITPKLLRELGFIQSLDFGKSKQELHWRGARLWCDGVALRFEGEVLPVDSIEQLTEAGLFRLYVEDDAIGKD